MGNPRIHERLPRDFIHINFTSWASVREYSTETEAGCLVVVRHGSEDMRETVAVEPDAILFATLAQLLAEPTLRMLTIITTVDNPDAVYKALALTHGVKYIGNGGKIMAADLAPSADTTPSTLSEEKLAAIDPLFKTQTEEKQGCVSFKVMSGERAVSSGQATVKDGIATFDGIFTEMDFQRRGLATIVMHYLVQWAVARGASIGLLNASPFGQKLYHKLGWVAVCDVVHVGGQPAVDFQERMRRKYSSSN